MSVEPLVLEFLGALEQSEQALLNWGLIDGFFTEREVHNAAEQFLDERREGDGARAATPDDLVRPLLEAALLWRLPYSGSEPRYRTRFAEAVRLFATLRQIFPDVQRRSWRTAPRLVSDYRLLRRPRAFPRRDVTVVDFVARARARGPLSPLQVDIATALLRSGAPSPLLLADFQVQAAVRVLDASRGARVTGTVVCAGTGSGKTLAFYLPAFLALAESLDSAFWTRCLAVYPRKELLKDQLRECVANARRMKATLRQHGRRGLVVGALYGEVPKDRAQVASRWSQCTHQARPAWRCPYLSCPECGGPVVWTQADCDRDVERLECVRPICGGSIEPDEVRLTRERMFASPPDVLFTTTEMLNQRLSTAGYAQLFGVAVARERQPRFVLLDEVHTYEGTNGAQAAYLLRRWRQRSRARPHFVGLSATLTDAARFFSDLVGIGPGDVNEVSPGVGDLVYEGAEYQLALRGDPATGTSLLSTGIQAAMLLRRVIAAETGNRHAGSKLFAFTDNLDAVNRLYHDLLDAEGRNALGGLARPLGSLANLRSRTSPNATDRFNVGQNWAMVEDLGHSLSDGEAARVGRTTSQDPGVSQDADIVVATSSLEVGFDDPEVGAVFQHKAPLTASAFMQRKGRAGRRRSMRPWTVVSLSDWGRDRRAYQNFDRLFSPVIDARYLPLDNPAILRMQGTYTLIDWLGTKLPLADGPDPWLDLAAPARPDSAKGRRQSIYAGWLHRLLDEDTARDDFALYLQRALGVSDEVAWAVLWQPPRAVLMNAVPTLLRRLETNFGRADGQGQDLHDWRAPLPDFVPRALFGDLLLPEIAIRIPAYRGRDPRLEAMPFVQALTEFAAGRVSRRFGLADAGERHWVHPGPDTATSIDVASICTSAEHQDLGRFNLIENGRETTIRVLRPYTLTVALPPANVRSSSNSTLQWSTELVAPAEPHVIETPAGSPWAGIIDGLRFCSHHLGLPLEVRRFAVAADASIVREGVPRVDRTIRFHQTRPGEADERVGLGFAADVDGIEVRISYPAPLHVLSATDLALLRGLRVARFRFLVATAPELDGIANSFQREWLGQVLLASVTIEALHTGNDLAAAEARVTGGAATTSPGQVAATILQWDDQGGNPQHAGQPRRLQELQALLLRPDVLAALHASAAVLWGMPDASWEPWLRARFRATLGSALAQAAHEVCPESDPEALYVEVNAFSRSHQADSRTLRDTLWLTEQTVSGGGLVEGLLTAYAEDPRRFFGLLEGTLGPSDLEAVAIDLARVAAYAASESPEHAPLRDAFSALRHSTSHASSSEALAAVRTGLAALGVLPTPTLLIALNARVLGPGSNESTDRLLAKIIAEWEHAERQLGIDIDPRVVALVHSRDTALETALGVVPEGRTEEARSVWRYGVLYGMLWPKGADLRGQMLRPTNPFSPRLEGDRLLVLAAVPENRGQVRLDMVDWFDELSAVLTKRGVAELIGNVGAERSMAEALTQVAAEAMDIGGVLAHARLSGLRRDNDIWRAIVELPEAFQ